MELKAVSDAVVADVSRCVSAVEPEPVNALVEALAAKRKVFLIGSGRSGTMLQAMAIRLGHLDVEANLVGSDGCPAVRKGDLVLVGSGSGRTPLSREHTEAAHEASASIAVITADPTSPVAEMAETVIHIPAAVRPADPSPHTLRSLFEECLLIVCDCVCRMLQDKLGASTADMQSRHSPTE